MYGGRPSYNQAMPRTQMAPDPVIRESLPKMILGTLIGRKVHALVNEGFPSTLNPKLFLRLDRIRDVVYLPQRFEVWGDQS